MSPAPAPAPAPDVAAAARLFHALSDETRLAVLELLRGGERCVCDLQDAVGAAQSRLSFHLKVLREAGLVTDRKEGRWSYYSLVPEQVAAAEAFLGGLRARRTAPPALLQLTRPARGVASGRPAGRAAGRGTGQAAARRDSCCS